MTKIVLLDYDVTLVDSLRAFFRRYNMTRVLYGMREVTWGEFMDGYRNDTLGPRGRSSAEFWDLFLRLYEVVVEEDYQTRPFDEVPRVLSELRDMGVRLVLLTGRKCSVSRMSWELGLVGLLRYFDLVLTGVSLSGGWRTDKGRLIGLALKVLGASRDEALFVGDYVLDVMGGKEAGVRTLQILRRGVYEVRHSDDVIYSLEGVFQYL